MKHLYVSEFDQFLNRLKRENPDIPEQQRKGRALLWDKLPSAPDGRPATFAQPFMHPGYVYFDNPPHRISDISPSPLRAARH
jgi:hypothetical protein